MIIRPEDPSDFPAILSVHRAAFHRPDAEEVAEVGLVEELRADGDVIEELSLVAVEDGAVTGHVLCSRGSLEETPAVGLGPIGVLPTRQGAGVGSALMREVIDRADAMGEPAVLVLGEPAYYSRFGFGPASEAGIVAPEEEWGPYFQALCLSAWMPRLGGHFSYAPAFRRL